MTGLSLEALEKNNSGAIELFKGKIITTINGKSFVYRNIVQEDFLDIKLDIRSCLNVYESLKNYVKNEIFENENGQIFEKNSMFKNMPKVLFITLLRFEFNKLTKKKSKINTNFIFYDVLDFKEFTYNKTENKYSLQAVLIHSGDIDFGHYYTFIKTDMSNKRWHKFDDNLVVECEERDVFSEGYGETQNISAYILVYTKTD
ncbi:unnamed protein product [Brachionus calyciflorus]|uniref:USP domain-containing protein n=1 Tax=Brachionus calyciflorus TaxID=104777 RepID=A0A813XTY7_9BILA|nr:unnamed protein product [Brachionus calyciflorus]